jgi:NADH-quinone oxidoreductase subunit M
MINFLIWAPLAGALVACAVPRRLIGWVACAGSLASLALAIVVLADFDPSGGLQRTFNESWIPDLGVSYSLGIDGISVFLVLLTATLWFAATAWSAVRMPERPRVWFLMMGLAESATLGAFCAQDLLLFVLFFDLMLIPFYFLFGSWGQDVEGDVSEPQPVTASRATIKMIVYTLVGSLLMLVGAIATAILTSDDTGNALTFSISELTAHPLGQGSQDWIFWFFAAAFLVKMPAFLVHGWMPDAYRVAPLPALAVFSAVLSKVAAYGFLRIVLPILPDATVKFQGVLMLIALASILYGSVMAFTQTNARLVAGYSSMAQLGFITLGIFTLRPDGADGAVLQMVNHGLVVAPLLLIMVVLVERAKSDDITKMGGLAMRAPVLAAMFLIITMALLAIPGSSNFIGELYILFGTFQTKIAIALVGFLGVAMAAYYALRLYQRAMHNRLRDGVESREIPLREGAIVGALVACIVALALQPNFILRRIDGSTQSAVASVAINDCLRTGSAGPADKCLADFGITPQTTASNEGGPELQVIK